MGVLRKSDGVLVALPATRRGKGGLGGKGEERGLLSDMVGMTGSGWHK